MGAATLLWGATFVVIRESLAGLDPVVLVFTRFTAAAALLGLALLPRLRALDRAALAGGTLAGLLSAGAYLFQAIGLTTTTAGTSAFLTSTGSLFAGPFAWLLLRQRPSAALTMGLVLALLGSVLMTRRSDLRLGPGEWWTLLAAVTYALQVVAVARFAPRADPLALTAIQAMVVAVALGPFAHGAQAQLSALTGPGWWRLAYLIVAGSALAPLLQVWAQRTLPAGRVGLLLALEPVFALGFAITLGRERYGARWWGGAALILLAVAMVERHAARRAASSPRASQ